MATIKDIARKLNISTSTVSYALNGGPRPVPEDVRERVLQTAKELDYRPNRLARTLITGRSYTLGVVPTGPYANLAFTPYFQGCFNGIVNQAENLGQDVLLFTRYDQAQTDKMADTLLDGRVDGLLFIAPVKGSPIFDFINGKIPYVVLSGEHRGAPVFSIDNSAGARAAVFHLFSLGHRRIAHIAGPANMDDAVERHDAFAMAMAELSLPIRDGYVVHGEFTNETGYMAAQKLLSLDPRPTAVFCANDEMAFGLLRACRDMGIGIPNELSVVGFDDAILSPEVAPPLTTVRQPWEDLAAAGTRALLAMIQGTPDVPGIRFDTHLIVRESTSSPQEDNPE